MDTFVPNDAFVVGDYGAGVAPEDEGEDDTLGCDTRDRNSIIVCTGANACGKASSVRFCIRHTIYTGVLQSVFIKQVALIQYMAQVSRHILWLLLLSGPQYYVDWVVISSCMSMMRLLMSPSFVPAASATLGVVDKSNGFSHTRAPWH